MPATSCSQVRPVPSRSRETHAAAEFVPHPSPTALPVFDPARERHASRSLLPIAARPSPPHLRPRRRRPQPRPRRRYRLRHHRPTSALDFTLAAATGALSPSPPPQSPPPSPPRLQCECRGGERRGDESVPAAPSRRLIQRRASRRCGDDLARPSAQSAALVAVVVAQQPFAAGTAVLAGKGSSRASHRVCVSRVFTKIVCRDLPRLRPRLIPSPPLQRRSVSTKRWSPCNVQRS